VAAVGYDALEAKVEVLDATGTVIAFDAAKAFYPQLWTEDQIQQAIYSAYVGHYRNGGSPFFVRQALTTPKGVVIEMRVGGSQTASGVKLKGIPTAFLRSGQHLTASHAP
jgi:hypothetical protein